MIVGQQSGTQHSCGKNNRLHGWCHSNQPRHQSLTQQQQYQIYQLILATTFVVGTWHWWPPIGTISNFYASSCSVLAFIRSSHLSFADYWQEQHVRRPQIGTSLCEIRLGTFHPFNRNRLHVFNACMCVFRYEKLLHYEPSPQKHIAAVTIRSTLGLHGLTAAINSIILALTLSSY